MPFAGHVELKTATRCAVRFSSKYLLESTSMNPNVSLIEADKVGDAKRGLRENIRQQHQISTVLRSAAQLHFILQGTRSDGNCASQSCPLYNAVVRWP